MQEPEKKKSPLNRTIVFGHFGGVKFELMAGFTSEEA